MKVFGFAGWSGSGKTTLIERLIPVLVERAGTVSLVKHAHHEFDIDQPGKDSFRHRQAGCTEVVVSSSRRYALMHELRGERELTLFEALRLLSPCEIVLVEGYKTQPIPKLEVWRPSVHKPLLHPADPAIRGVATDEPGAIEGSPFADIQPRRRGRNRNVHPPGGRNFLCLRLTTVASREYVELGAAFTDKALRPDRPSWARRSAGPSWKMTKNQSLTLVVALAAAVAGSALAAEPAPAAADNAGFYGGISLRAAGQESEGVTLGHLTSSVWNRFAPPLAEDNGSRTLAYGGYRWLNDVAVEAALSTLDRFSLQPTAPGTRRGVGLALTQDSDPGKAWNVDVYTTWEFRKRMSLYGRLGYAQTETQAQTAYGPSFTGEVVRRNRDGVNYGLGLRYDMTPALGLRLEYARFSRLPGELATGVMPESDQVQLGLQFRF